MTTRPIREVMTAAPVALSADTPVVEVARKMRDEDIGAVLVMQNTGQLRGLVTDRDLAVRILAEDSENVTTMTALDACSPEVIAVGPDDGTDRAVELMHEYALRRLPVVKGDQAIGMVALGDLAVEHDLDSVLGSISAAQPNT
ncbi:CBS domain-containing protein [Streptomyces smyrnaeus]|uniref:CBS domain-containing protein n=1 Tax=Streptomyces smyrnaeus TaxID=1387713 RepID=UPI00367499D9